MSINEIDWEKLEEPFSCEELDWVGIFGMKDKETGEVWLEIAPYVTARAIQDRLDSVCGKYNWRNSFTETAEGMLCNISIKVDGEWITKSDGAEKHGREPLKTACSNAMKRAAVQFGIGRYLYYLPRMFADVKNDRKATYYRYELKDKTKVWYMPNSTAIETVKAIKEASEK